MLLTETDQWRKPSEAIWPEIVATRDALWPEEMSAKAKMLAAVSEWLNNCCFQDTKLFTPSNEVANNKVSIEISAFVSGTPDWLKAALPYNQYPAANVI